MRRVHAFKVSPQLYAVQLDGLKREQVGVIQASGKPLFRYEIPMLDNFPAVPPGFTGWWTYR